MSADSAPAEPVESKETKKPETYGEPFIVPESGKTLLEQMPFASGPTFKREAALARVPGGKVQRAKLARENGQLIWSIDIITPLTKKLAAVQVDAYSGKVLSKQAQTPGDRPESP
jgi:hypothetical protein